MNINIFNNTLLIPEEIIRVSGATVQSLPARKLKKSSFFVSLLNMRNKFISIKGLDKRIFCGFYLNNKVNFLDKRGQDIIDWSFRSL